LRTRAGVPPGAVPILYGDDQWREANSGPRLAFFILTLAAALAFYAFVALLIPDQDKTPLVVVGVLSISLAEWLIDGRRFFRMGPEEALWIVGIQAIVFRILALFDHGNPEKATILIGAGFLLAGWRLLNPLFVDIAVICFCWYAKAVTSSWSVGAFAAFISAVAAMALLLREWRRPSHDAMLEWLVVTMPVVGYVGLKIDRSLYRELDLVFDRSLTDVGGVGNWLVALLFVAIAVASAFVARRSRLHPPLLVSIFAGAVVLYECRDLMPAPVEWKLIAAGGLLLAAAIVVERRLRDRDHGITSKKLELTPDMRLFEALGGLALTGTSSTAVADSSRSGGGGSFGGGGASSDF
jgi:hypothetical protein